MHCQGRKGAATMDAQSGRAPPAVPRQATHLQRTHLQLGAGLVGCGVEHPPAAALNKRQLRPKVLCIGLRVEAAQEGEVA
jgi:hypothetical protein